MRRREVSKLKVGVLASGRGSNLQAILDEAVSGRIEVEVVVVISDVENAHALDRARAAGVPALHIPPGHFKTKLEPEVEDSYVEALEQHGVEIVALAGFMRILHERFFERFAGRIVNVHPALLPSFPGLDAQAQALEYGVKWTGATVHFVDDGVDTGPIIMQAVVPVEPDDTRDTLAARILAEEHRIYPLALHLIALGRVSTEGRLARIEPESAKGDSR
jgi:phosphoribosylglycinamide formyltransferase-1